jgi:hypothetical protein
MAASAFVKIDTGIGRHLLSSHGTAIRTGQDRLKHELRIQSRYAYVLIH